MTGTVSANRWRGEAALHLGSTAYAMRPSFAALVAAEDELGSLFALIERASAGQLRLAELAGLFWHCLADRAGMTREVFSEEVACAGLAQCTEPLKVLLVQVLRGGE
ncbi:MAG: hypothetical protein NVSMB69_18310 [Novosphingobium sp.]